jgi:hypothetical protein
MSSLRQGQADPTPWIPFCETLSLTNTSVLELMTKYYTLLFLHRLAPPIRSLLSLVRLKTRSYNIDTKCYTIMHQYLRHLSLERYDDRLSPSLSSL